MTEMIYTLRDKIHNEIIDLTGENAETKIEIHFHTSGDDEARSCEEARKLAEKLAEEWNLEVSHDLKSKHQKSGIGWWLAYDNSGVEISVFYREQP